MISNHLIERFPYNCNLFQSGCTSLAAAVKGRHCRIVSLFLKQGADPNEIIDEVNIIYVILLFLYI